MLCIIHKSASPFIIVFTLPKNTITEYLNVGPSYSLTWLESFLLRCEQPGNLHQSLMVEFLYWTKNFYNTIYRCFS